MKRKIKINLFLRRGLFSTDFLDNQISVRTVHSSSISGNKCDITPHTNLIGYRATYLRSKGTQAELKKLSFGPKIKDRNLAREFENIAN